MTLKTQQLKTLPDVRAFLEGSQPIGFEVTRREAAYAFVLAQLRHFGYSALGKADKVLSCSQI